MAPLQKLLDYYDQLERLVTKLPKPLQQPILNEIKPIKDLFLRQRPPRIAIVGDPATDLKQLLGAIFGAPVEAGERLEEGLWREYRSPANARLHILDARPPVEQIVARESLAEVPADLYLLVQNAGTPFGPWESTDDLLAARKMDSQPVLLSLLITDGAVEAVEAGRQALHAAVRGDAIIRGYLVSTLAVCPVVRFRQDGTLDEESDRRDGIEKLAQVITRELPQEAKLEMARLSQVGPVQLEIAQLVVKSISVICGAIGAQPIPLADFPILTSLQAMMVAAVMYISGKPLNFRRGAEFIAALGANMGLGLVLREGSRALLKFLPGWGNAISGGVAGAGTYAIGRAAIAYFIEGRPMAEARRVFQRRKPKALPAPPRDGEADK